MRTNANKCEDDKKHNDEASAKYLFFGHAIIVMNCIVEVNSNNS